MPDDHGRRGVFIHYVEKGAAILNSDGGDGSESARQQTAGAAGPMEMPDQELGSDAASAFGEKSCNKRFSPRERATAPGFLPWAHVQQLYEVCIIGYFTPVPPDD